MVVLLAELLYCSHQLVSDKRLKRQIQASTFAGFQAALHVLAFAVLFLPILALINLIFHRDIWGSLSLSLVIGTAIAVVWFVATFTSTLLDLRKHDRVGSTATASFPATTFVAGLYGVTCIASAWLIVGLHKEREPVWMQLLALGFVFVAFYGWPRTIHCNDTSVSQRSLWGRKRTIPYSAVEAISSDHQGTTTVLGGGVTIEHTRYHIDPEIFRQAVARRSGKPVY